MACDHNMQPVRWTLNSVSDREACMEIADARKSSSGVNGSFDILCDRKAHFTTKRLAHIIIYNLLIAASLQSQVVLQVYLLSTAIVPHHVS